MSKSRIKNINNLGYFKKSNYNYYINKKNIRIIEYNLKNFLIKQIKYSFLIYTSKTNSYKYILLKKLNSISKVNKITSNTINYENFNILLINDSKYNNKFFKNKFWFNV